MPRLLHVSSIRLRLVAATGLLALAATSVPPTATASPAGVGSGFRALAAVAGPLADDGPGPALDRDGDGIVAAPPVPVAAPRVTIELEGTPEMAVITGVAPGTEFAVRSRNHGTWSEWIHVESDDDERPDGGAPTTSGVGPIWLGEGADRLQIEREHGAPVPFEVEVLHAVEPPADTGVQGATASTAAPFIRPRSAWATSAMGWPAGCGSEPARGSAKAIVVHHTAGTNGYTAADVPAVIRGIWYYHAQSRGWCDIAYNFLVDRFGGVWEGRQGGITEPIVGGHTFGFNTDTVGIAQLGDFDAGGPPYALTRATWRLVGWKAGVHGIDPLGRTTVTNRASVPAKNGTPPGGTVTIPTVVGHRDLGSTSCPGHNTYAHRHTIRSRGFDGAHAYAMYRALVRRMPMDRSYLDAAAALEAHGARVAAKRIAYSDDYAGVAIDDLYQLILDRRADAAGRAHWLDYVNAGNRLETVATRFFASAEYFDKQLRTNLVYVDSLYDKILGRTSDAGGALYWTRQLDEGRMTRRQVAGHFYSSLESREKRVERLYQQLLGRGVDASGRDTWARKLVTVDDLALATFLVSSEEFRVRFV